MGITWHAEVTATAAGQNRTAAADESFALGSFASLATSAFGTPEEYKVYDASRDVFETASSTGSRSRDDETDVRPVNQLRAENRTLRNSLGSPGVFSIFPLL